MYVYQADLWCDSCGEQIQKDIAAGRATRGSMPDNPLDESSFDSDEFPKHATAGECDSPGHCAAGSMCLEALDLAPYGAREDALEGAESVKIGALIEDKLTDHGVEYLREMLDEPEPTPYQAALHKFWREAFNDYL